MGDTMLLGVLRMPVDDHGDLGLMQFIARAQEAADRIEQDAGRIADLERAIKFQASAAKRGMDAAKAHAGHMESEARRLHAECNPEALESERQANAQLTEENAALATHVERLREALQKIDADLEGRNFLESSSLRDTARAALKATEEG